MLKATLKATAQGREKVVQGRNKFATK